MAVRNVVSAAYNAHTSNYFNSLRLLKLDDIFKYQAGKLVKNFIDRELPPSFDGYFKLTSDINQRKTQSRYPKTLYYNRKYKKQYKMKFERLSTITIPKTWNSIPREIRTQDKISTLAREYKNYLLSKYSEDA